MGVTVQDAISFLLVEALVKGGVEDECSEDGRKGTALVDFLFRDECNCLVPLAQRKWTVLVSP